MIAAWMGVGLWCFGSTEIPTEQVMGWNWDFRGMYVFEFTPRTQLR